MMFEGGSRFYRFFSRESSREIRTMLKNLEQQAHAFEQEINRGKLSKDVAPKRFWEIFKAAAAVFENNASKECYLSKLDEFRGYWDYILETGDLKPNPSKAYPILSNFVKAMNTLALAIHYKCNTSIES